MTKHPHAVLLEKMYADFARGDLAAVIANCAPGITFEVKGKSPLAGKYDATTFASKYVMQLMERSGGTLQVEVHDILASDRHGLVLISDKLVRGGKPVEYRAVHVWRFEGGGGKPVAWYEYPRDLYQFDAIWS